MPNTILGVMLKEIIEQAILLPWKNFQWEKQKRKENKIKQPHQIAMISQQMDEKPMPS